MACSGSDLSGVGGLRASPGVAASIPLAHAQTTSLGSGNMSVAVLGVLLLLLV